MGLGIAWFAQVTGRLIESLSTSLSQQKMASRIVNILSQVYPVNAIILPSFNPLFRKRRNFEEKIEALHHHESGSHYMDQKQYGDAIAEFTQAINLGWMKDVYFQRGFCYHQIGEYDKASEDYRYVIEHLNPTLTAAYLYRGIILSNQFNFRLALHHLEKAGELGIKLGKDYAKQLKKFLRSHGFRM